jgi:putative ABC transport system permease protein
MRQVLSESVLLVSIGAVAAVGVAFFGMRLLITSAPEGAAVGLGPRIDAWVMLFTVAVAIVSGVFFALVPAWQVSRLVPYDYIKGGARTVSAGPGRQRLRAGIVVVETALAMVLLVVAGLLIRSLMRLETINPGFEPHGVVTASLTLPDTQYKAAEQRAAFYRTVLERLAAIPGVQIAGAGGPLPFVGGDSSASFRVEGRSPAPGDPGPHGSNRWVTPSYFASLGIPLERGRVFTDADRAGAERVVVVDEILARRYWPGQDPIDKRISRGGTTRHI